MKALQKIIAVILFAVTITFAHAQKQTNNWFFGINAGLDFNSGSAVTLTTGALNTTEGCSTISDAGGNLLFYTEGVNVWNATHSIMPNGTGLQGDVSTTQSALIVKKPNSSTLYYIFTLPAEGSGNFCYSIVDITLDGGKGDVTTKNAILKGNVTEKMSAVHHCNGRDVWVTIHELNNNSFYSYLVSPTGIGSPVISTTGRKFTEMRGQIKFNNTGTRLACLRDTMLQMGPPYQGKASLDLYNFNNQTGVVTYSLSILLNNWQKSYGVEFSPDNTKLYASYYDQSGPNAYNSEIMQFNLTATNVAASGVTVAAALDPTILRAMQVGPDGKIYVSKSNTPFLCVIGSPNLSGAACNYTDNAIDVDPASMGSGCMLGLPGFVQSYFNPAFPLIVTCPENTTSVTGEVSLSGPMIFYDRTNEEIRLSNFSDEQDGKLIIYDLMGQVILTRALESAEHSVPVSDLPTGIYLVRFESSSVSFEQKIIR
jgi:hypothetical protein